MATASTTSIATWTSICIDCPDPEQLARFYHGLTGLPLHDWGGGYFSVGDEGAIAVVFERVEGYQAPTWPTQQRGQQLHLCFQVDDLATAVADAEALGASLAEAQPGDTWRVLLDPAGHPFCLSPRSQEPQG